MNKPKRLKDGDIFRRKGSWFQVKHEQDDRQEPPQKNEDGHGVVTDWLAWMPEDEAREQGLWLLVYNRGAKGCLYYDFRKTLAIAIRDGWSCGKGGKSLSARRRAVRKDFEHLYGYYNDQWSYVGVIVQSLTGRHRGKEAALWGIESKCVAYLTEVAKDLADEIMS